MVGIAETFADPNIAATDTSWEQTRQRLAQPFTPPPAPLPPAEGVPDALSLPVQPPLKAPEQMATQEPTQAPQQMHGGGGGVFSRADIARYQQPYRDAENLAADYGNAAGMVAEDEAKAYRERTKVMKESQEIEALQQTVFDNQLEMRNQQVEKARKEANEKAKLDPNRIWKQRGVGAQVAAAIAAGMGAFASTVSGGPNFALDIINRAVDQDIEAQRDEYERAKDKVNEARSDYAMFRQQGFDDRQARLLARQNKLDVVDSKITEAGAALKNLDSQKRVADLQIGIRQGKDQLEMQLKQINHAAAQQAAATEAARAANIYKAQADAVQQQNERAVSLPDGTKVLAGTKEEAEKLKTANAAREEIKALFSRMRGLVNDYRQVGWPASNVELEGIASQIKTKMAVMNGMGAISGTDERLVTQFANPTDWFQFDDTVIKSIDSAEQSLDQGYTSALVARGVIPKGRK